MKSMHHALTLSAAIAVAGLVFTANPAAAANSAMAECNKQWNDATASNSTNGVAYQDYLKACLKKNSTTTTTSTTNTATTTSTGATTTATDGKAAKTACNAQWKALDAAAQAAQTKKDFVAACVAKASGDAPAATAASTAKPAATAAADAMPAVDPAVKAKTTACNSQWKAMDAATKGTQKKKDFVAACIAGNGAAPADKTMAAPADKTMAAPADKTMAAPADKTMAAPAATATKAIVAPASASKTMAAPAPAATTTTVATPPDPNETATAAKTDANAKPKTPGQLAMDTRIKECGVEWKKAKADPATDPAIVTAGWPKYWSACNKRLKATTAAN